MIALFLGLSLLLMPFLAALEPLDGLREIAAYAGAPRWLPELLLAASAVALFLRAGNLNRRLLYPRRGLRLLAAGIALDALGLAAATGWLVRAADLLARQWGAEAAALPGLVAQLPPLPVFIAAQLLLVVGAFRALANLVSPTEFQADF